MNRENIFGRTDLKKDIKKLYGAFVVILCIACVILSAHYSAITLDEAHTYLDYVMKFRISAIGEFFETYDGRANNHLLNTILIYFVDRISGIHYDEFVIRIPNICFGIFFGVFSFFLYMRNELSTLEFSLLMLCSSLNTAFSQARGYGMAACLSLIALYYIKKYAEEEYLAHNLLIRAILFLTLAEAANTVVLLLTAALAVVLFILMVWSGTLKGFLCAKWKSLIPLGCVNGLLLAYHLYVSIDGEGKKLASFHGNPFEGMIGNFLQVYVGRFASVCTLLAVAVLVITTVYGIRKRKQFLFSYTFFVYFMLCSAMAVIAGKGMPSDKALLPAYPLIIFAIQENIEFIWENTIKHFLPGKSRIPWMGFTAVCSCFLVFRFCANISFEENNALRAKLYDSAMGGYKKDISDKELHWLHRPFYHKQFLYRYGYDLYLKDYTMESMSLAETLKMLHNPNYDALIDVCDWHILHKYAYEFAQLGINVFALPADIDFILLDQDEEGVRRHEYVCGFRDGDHSKDTIRGKMGLYYGEHGSYGVYMDGGECLIVDPAEMLPVAGICVWHNGEEEPLGYKLFDI